MTEPFSANDVYYTNASCNTNPSIGCLNLTDGSDKANCECKYKENVDKLISIPGGLTKGQNSDLNESHTLLLLNNISLAIGIVGMMWMIYSPTA